MDLPWKSTFDGEGDVVPLFLELGTHFEDISGRLERITANLTSLLDGLNNSLLFSLLSRFIGIQKVQKLLILFDFFPAPILVLIAIQFEKFSRTLLFDWFLRLTYLLLTFDYEFEAGQRLSNGRPGWLGRSIQ